MAMATPIVASSAEAIPLIAEGAIASEAAAGSAGSSAASAGEAIGVVESVAGGLDSLLNPAITAWQIASAADAEEQHQKNIDRAFEENKRRFGLEFALREFSTRKGIEMQEARDQFNRKQSAQSMRTNKAISKENIKTSALGRYQAETQMSWAKDDREKKEKMAKAYSTGLLSGLGGGGEEGLY